MQKILHRKKILLVGQEPPWEVSNGWVWHSPSSANIINNLKKHAFIEQISPCELDKVFKKKEKYNISALRNITGVIFQHKNLSRNEIDKMTEYSHLFRVEGIRIINNPYNSNLFFSKNQFYRKLSKANNFNDILIPTHVVKNRQDLAIAIKKFGYPLVLRPDSLSGGVGVARISNLFSAHIKTIALKRKNTQQAKKNSIHHEPIEIYPVLSPYIDSWSPDYKCYTNGAAYFWGGKMWFADARLSSNGFNIHAKSGQNKLSQNSPAIAPVLTIIGKYKSKLEQLASALGEWSLRLDLVIDLQQKHVWVCEAEIKGGPGEIMRNKIYPMLANYGWNYTTVRQYIGATARPSCLDIVKYVGLTE